MRETEREKSCLLEKSVSDCSEKRRIPLKKSREKLEMGKTKKTQFPRNSKYKGDTLVELTQAALVTAVFCVLAPLTLYFPFSPVGITLGSFFVYLTALLLGTRLGCISVLLYLCLGFIGLPVFSGYTAGVGVLFGPTGGFLLGYLPCVVIVGAFAKKATGKKGMLQFLIGTVIGTGALYTVGSLWFMFVYGRGASFREAIIACVVPFLPFDAIKIGVSVLLYQPFVRLRRLAGNYDRG